jgi:PDZ domain-containing protein
VALFANDELEYRGQRRRRGRGWLGWGIVALVLVAGIVVGLLPSPYVIEKPGPVYDTLGTTEVDGEDVPLIEIPREETFPTDGSLDMLTVSVTGSPEHPATWIETLTARFRPGYAVVPIESVYPKGVTVEQSNEQANVDMQNSQREAIAAALRELGYTFSSTLTVEEVIEGLPADGKLNAGDIITGINGRDFADVTALKAVIADNGADAAATVSVERDGKRLDVSVTPVIEDGATAPVIGVVLSSDYDFPFDVSIQLENVGGPSAGQMFALGIIDKLTPGALTGGADIAGTGTITASGEIGPIGGIRQKMYGALDAGADFFLAPEGNCGEVTGNVPEGLTVFAVETLDDSLAALEAVAAGSDTSALPACPLE